MRGWPGGRRWGALVGVHFDAEALWTSRDPANADRPVTLSQGAFGARRGVDALLAVLARHRMPATFFVPAQVAERHAEVVARIVDAGHPLACHGDAHERLGPEATADEEAAILRRSVEALTGAAGRPPRGHGAPGWSLTPRTLGLLAEHGLRYSANLMDDVRPYVHELDGGRLAELPVHWLLDDAPFRLAGPGLAAAPRPMAEVGAVWEEERTALREAGGLWNLTLHPQLSGRPSAARVVDELLGRVRAAEDVWTGTYEDLAEHVLAEGG